MPNLICIDCGLETLRTGQCQKRCPLCRDINTRLKAAELHLSTYKRKGYDQLGKKNNAYKNGIGTYKAKRKGQCEFCGDIRFLCVHHIDENRFNNDDANLATLCRSCHVLVHANPRDPDGKFIKKEIKNE